MGKESNFLPDWLDEKEEWSTRVLKNKVDAPLLKTLVKSGYLEKKDEVEDTFLPKTVEHISLTKEVLKTEKKIESVRNSLNRAKVQQRTFDLLLEQHFHGEKVLPFEIHDLIAQGVSRAILSQMENKGIIERGFKEVPRINFLEHQVKSEQKTKKAKNSLFFPTIPMKG